MSLEGERCVLRERCGVEGDMGFCGVCVEELVCVYGEMGIWVWREMGFGVMGGVEGEIGCQCVLLGV